MGIIHSLKSMINEEKEINGQPAPVDEAKEVKNPDASQEDVQEEDAEQDSQEIDYKAELEKAKAILEKKEKQLGQAEHKIVELKKQKKEEFDEFDEFDEEEKDNRPDVKEVIREELNVFKREMSSERIDETISKLTDNPDEIALIKHHYENSIKPTGFDKESIAIDIQNAYTLANAQKILKQNNELKEALKAKKTISGGTGGSSAGKAVKSSGYPDTLSQADISFLKSQGITPEKYNKLNKK
jgi:hypothetical protein